MIDLLQSAAAAEYAPLPERETHRLIRQARRRGVLGRQAMQTLILSNFRLVLVTVSKYRRLATDTVTPDDLVQVACLGFMNAVKKFDPRRGVKFCTYAVASMRRWLRRALDNSDQLRIPVHLQDRRRRVGAAAAQLASAGVRAPTRARLASASGLTERQLEILSGLPRVAASLDEPRGEKEQSTLGETLPDPAPADPDSGLDRAALIEFLQSKLSIRHYRLLALYFGLHPRYPGGLQMDEIAALLGVSRQAIQQNLQIVIGLLGDGLSIQMRALLQPEQR